MKTTTLEREFRYNSVKLADPSPAMSLLQVRDFFANVYPEIISADIEGPELVGDKHVYSFRRAVGTKGRATVTMRQLLADLIALGNARKLSDPDLALVKRLQQLAASGKNLSICQAQLLVELQRRYLPAADK